MGNRRVPRHGSPGGGRGWVRRLLPFMRLRPANILLALGTMAAGGVVGSVLPLVQRQLLDRALAGRVGALWAPLGLLFGIGAFAYVLQRVAGYRELKAANDLQYLLYDAVHRRVQQIDGAAVDSLSPGQLAARLNSDIGALSRALAQLPRLAGVVLPCMLTVGLMLVLNPLLAGAALLVLPVQLLVSLQARRAVLPATWDAQEREADVAQAVSEGVTGIRVVKAFGQEQREIDRMATLSAGLYRARMRLTRLQALFQPILESLSTAVQVMIVLLGGWLVLRHRMSLGTFVAFGAYSSGLVATVKWFADTVIGMQEAGVCANRVLDLIDLPPAVVERPDARPLRDIWGEVRLSGVRFGYRDGTAVLDGLHLRVGAGETVALVGLNGSGKSTVLRMLARLHDPQDGAVVVDGVDMRRVTLDSLRRRIGVVFEEPFLFSGTLRDNIRFGRPDAQDWEVVAAARAACADEFIERLPDGYDTVVSERGQTLSGGQRQRIALARALLTGPRILLLDNATGAVDARTEREVHRRLRAAADGRTTVFVAYRASTLAMADRIVVLDAGRVVDHGSHDELMARCALYRRLADPVSAAQWTEPDQLLPRAGITPSAWRPYRRKRSAPRDVPASVPPAPATDHDDRPFSLRALVRQQRIALACVAALVVLQALVGVFAPSFTRDGVDRGILAGSMRGLVTAAVAIALTALAGLLVGTVSGRLTARVGQRLIYALRMRMWAHLIWLPIAYHERQKAGRLMTRMVNDVEVFSDLVADGVAGVLVALLTLAGALVAMFLVSALLAGLVLASVIPLIGGLAVLNRKILRAYAQTREETAEANAALQENLAGVREAQAFGQSERQHTEYQRLVRRFLDSRFAAEKLIAATFPLTSLLTGLASALVLGVGAGLLAAHALTAGALIAFTLWVNIFFGPLQQLAAAFGDWNRVLVSTNRINLLMRHTPGMPVPARPHQPRRLQGELYLSQVRFRYPNTESDVLHSIDLRVPVGETIAFVGATGAGKSTIVKLLARFYDPTAGQVLVDGTDLRSMDLAAYRARLGYLPQEPFLFPGTIRENIAYGRPDALDGEIEAAARAVGAHRAICRLAGGYLHRVGQRGDSLSAGERQLVCLARAYLANPAIVLLDEATSSLDLSTEAQVLRAMRTVSRGRTTIMIAHRLQTARLADRIAVIGDGRIVELGTHAQLLAMGGRYAELYEASYPVSVQAA